MKKQVDPNAANIACRDAKTSRWVLYHNIDGRTEHEFLLAGVNEGEWEFTDLHIIRNSNWVYPFQLIVPSGRVNLTQYEMEYLLSEYIRFTNSKRDDKCL